MTNDTAPSAAPTEDDWRRVAEAALKGRPLDSILRHRTIDGVTIEALAARRTTRPIAGRPAGAPWAAMARLDLADPAAANAQALEDLNNGAAGLEIVLAPPGGTHGLVADTLDRLDRALDGVLLDMAPLRLQTAPFRSLPAAALAAALVERRGLDPAGVDLAFGVDLIRDLMLAGGTPKPWAEMRKRLAGLATALHARGFRSPILAMDGRPAHLAGASEAQELAGALAHAVEHVRALVDGGVDLAAAVDAVSFTYACDADQFATIAKLRAARLLWSAVRREYGLGDAVVRIHAETSVRMMTRDDPQTNMIRTAIAAFAAGVGGADSLTVLPYAHALGAEDPTGRRLARNVQTILMEESNVHRVADPASGAGAIEALTDAIAQAAWAEFREIERAGGVREALASGMWQARIAASQAARDRAVATRRSPIVGVSEFPRLSEGPAPAANPTRPAEAPATRGFTAPDDGRGAFDATVAAYLDGASTADVAGSVRAETEPPPPLRMARLSEPFEAIRGRNEAKAARPAAFLALIGPVARHAARAGFTRNLLAAGGIAAIDGPIAADATAVDAAAIADAYGTSGAGLAVLCGADDGYAEHGAAVAAALKARGGEIWLAGNPKEGRDALEQAGVARFVAAGDDALATLEEASRRLSPPDGATEGPAT